jgi:hypothetical protein
MDRGPTLLAKPPEGVGAVSARTWMEHIPTPPSLGRELKDKVAKRLRQDSKPLLNKLETEYYGTVEASKTCIPI